MSATVSAALTERRAVRAYLSQPVPDNLVREILTEARWAPSAVNTQSTDVYILSGAPLERFKADLREYSESEAPPAPDLEGNMEWPPVLQARMQELFQTRMSFVAAEEHKMGVQPPDPPVSPMVAMAGLFRAPILLVLAFDKAVATPYGCFDAGLFAQSIALAAHGRGLGTCIMTSTVRYPELLRKVISGTEGKNFMAVLTLGYPDWQAPVNRFPRTRATVDEFATFVR